MNADKTNPSLRSLLEFALFFVIQATRTRPQCQWLAGLVRLDARCIYKRAGSNKDIEGIHRYALPRLQRRGDRKGMWCAWKSAKFPDELLI